MQLAKNFSGDKTRQQLRKISRSVVVNLLLILLQVLNMLVLALATCGFEKLHYTRGLVWHALV